jgi:hypothetical protein
MSRAILTLFCWYPGWTIIYMDDYNGNQKLIIHATNLLRHSQLTPHATGPGAGIIVGVKGELWIWDRLEPPADKGVGDKIGKTGSSLFFLNGNQGMNHACRSKKVGC